MRKTIIIFAWLWVAVVSVQTLYPNLISSLLERLSFGTASYPTSLDTTTTLPNPGATDSVATVSHSALHTNENGAIEAVESKLGTTASTPIEGSILVGNGTGSSLWSIFATTTSLWATNLFANGSSTFQSFTGVNGTTTNATSTNIYISSNLLTLGTASSTSLNANNGTIGTLTVGSCVGCSSTSIVSTTSAQVLATSTLSGIPASSNTFGFLFHSTSTVAITSGKTVAGIDTQACVTFNTFSSSSLYSYNYREILGATTDGAAGQSSNKLCVSPQGAGQGTEVLITGTIMNKSGLWKNGRIEAQYTSNAGTVYHNFTDFIWKDTSQITSISFDTASTTAGFGTSTYITTY